jgi:tetratricopeptide (TPR) repeat protein
LFLAVEKDAPSTWIFSKNHTSWGSYFYDPKEDALRIPTQLQEAPYTEWLTFTFEDRQPNTATVVLQWENKKVPLKIDVPNADNLYVAKMREELRSSPGLNWRAWTQAAQFCAQRKINLEEALQWADYAINAPFVGEENFTTLQTKAMVLTAMGKETEAEVIMDKAIRQPTATVQAVHQYGRTLLDAGKKEKAMEVFKRNRQLHPEDTFTTYVGLARGYTAIGDKKNAIKNWETAIKNLPENQKANAAFYESELKKLKG